ncbi:hypothetical protein BKA64DRAFT_696230 [Cadophora sp. MPI-SDFR-AT-0126]|nr:hypothetical protein BKA64DRAFT_696230 [Leotiomycetes sp. MPI-SDFR-AT-0126]
MRQEWRSLNATSQQAYISTVICLMHHPSILHSDSSYYDDFVYVHTQSGQTSHYAAAFLPWHRMFVRTYEQALQEKCGYKGVQPYWDWTLDSADLSKSPIWDPDHGFGGNGDLSTPETIHNGHCVPDGPFANTTRQWHAIRGGEFHSVAREPHCLSRGFLNAGMISGTDREKSSKFHRHISPEHVEHILQQPDYLSFFKLFESGAHNAIPQFLRGDWLVFSAPNDPVFFLHHTQVDRLWWLWQERDVKTRAKDYHGPKEDFRHHPESTGSKVSDVLSTDGFVPDGKVEDFLDTKNGLLCYEY